MPDEYRTSVLRFVEMHANSELMGVLPEREWIMRAPTLRRKLALTAKVQDEVGHAQLLYRVAEDLGKPRDAMFEDLLARQDEVPQRLPLPDEVVGRHRDHRLARRRGRDRRPAGAPRLVSYAPYARTMRKICWEESVHIMHGRDVVVTMVNGTTGPARDGPGGARPLVGPADADARPAQRPGEGPRHPLADQGEDVARSCARSSCRSTCRGSGSSGLTLPDPELRPRPSDRRVALHGAGLAGAPDRRHEPRAEVRGAPRVPAAQLRRDPAGCATRSSPTPAAVA